MGLILYVDGGARGNPGPAGAGVVITTDDGTLIHEAAYFLGHQTNNAAEYHALIRGLQRVAQRGEQRVSICSDSELLVRQITGQYRVRSAPLSRLYEQVQLLLLKIQSWHIRHVAREANRRADQLANLAMDQQRDLIVFDADSGQAQPVPPASAPAAHVGQTPPSDLAQAALPAGQAPAQPAPPPPPQPVTTAPRAARVTLATEPRPGGCPARQPACAPFTVEMALPAGLCIHAAHALLPTILAVLNTPAGEFAAIPTLTVRCMHPGCGAVFHVAPVRGSNGATQREPPS